METQYKNLNYFFTEVLSTLNCQYDTRAYIISIFSKFKNTDSDFSKDSVTLIFSQARNKQDFLTFQNLGDYIFFSKSFAKEHLRHASEEYYRTIARLSYYNCYSLTKRQLKFYEELADNFIILEKQTRELVNKINNSKF